jgi:signal transduction histidine kinase
VELVVVVAVSAVLSGLLILLWRLRRRLVRVELLRRSAVERRDRFLAEAAGELQAPLTHVRNELSGLTSRTVTAAKLAELTRDLDGMRAMVDELARLPRRVTEIEREEVDLAEVVRDVVAASPFPEFGPSVIVRAQPTVVWGDRARLLNGLRMLLWVLRREAAELVITVNRDDDRARVEIDSRGARAAVDTLEQLPAVDYGLRASTAPPATSLALRVAAAVAAAHGGRVRASTRAGQGERFVVDLPAIAA